MALIKVKRDGPKGYRLIDEGTFDAAKHEIWSDEEDSPEPGKMKVAELRAALEAKGVDIPAGTKKPALQALYDKHCE